MCFITIFKSHVTDIDECIAKTDNCDNNTECTNTLGSYDCICKPGFVDVDGDGKNCTGMSFCLAVFMLILDYN